MSIRAEITPPWNQSESSERPSSSRQGSRISTAPSSARTSSSPISRWKGEVSTRRCELIPSRGRGGAQRRRATSESPLLLHSGRALDGDGRGVASSLGFQRRELRGPALERRPIELSRATERQLLEEEDAARVRVRGAALQEEAFDLLLVRRRRGIASDDVGDRRLALGGMRRRDDAGILQPGMPQEDVLDLLRVEVLAGHVDHVVLPA